MVRIVNELLLFKPYFKFFHTDRNKHRHHRNQHQRFFPNIHQASSFKHNIFNDDDKIFRGHYLTQVLQDDWHIFNRYNKS